MRLLSAISGGEQGAGDDRPGRSPGASGFSVARTAWSRRCGGSSASRPAAAVPAPRAIGAPRATGARRVAAPGAVPRGAGPGARACGYVAPTRASVGRTAARSSRAAASGSAASVSARTTAIRAAPGGRARRRGCSASMPPMAKNGTARVRGRVAHQLEPDRRAPGLGRGGVDRADADVVDAGWPRVDLRRACGWRGRRVRSARPPARACATGMSSWPTWTPSAPAATRQVGRSLTMNRAPCARAQPAEAPGRRQGSPRRRRPSPAAGRGRRRRAGRRRGRRRRGRRRRGRDGRGQARRRRSSHPQSGRTRRASMHPNGSPATRAERADDESADRHEPDRVMPA